MISPDIEVLVYFLQTDFNIQIMIPYDCERHFIFTQLTTIELHFDLITQIHKILTFNVPGSDVEASINIQICETVCCISSLFLALTTKY